MAWRFFFEAADEYDSRYEIENEANPWKRYRKRPKITPECPGPLSVVQQQFISSVTQGVWDACLIGRGRWFQHRRRLSNYCGLHACAFDMLRRGRLGVIPTDKDGGVCLVDKATIILEKIRLLQSPQYKPIACTFEAETDYFDNFKNSVVLAAEALGDHRMVPAFLSWGSGGIKGMISRLNMTIKSHKDPGEVTFGAIHSSTESPMKGAMGWISSLLQSSLRGQRHILRDSAELLDQLRELHVAVDDTFLKIDIKDYYMSGKYAELQHYSSLAVEAGPRREAYKHLVSAILANQIISVDGILGKLWSVEMGTGMGLLSSGEISDACFPPN